MISGSLPPGTTLAKLTDLIKQAQAMGLHCIVDSSGDALQACLDVGGLALVKPNQNELSALIGRSLEHPDDVRAAAKELVQRGELSGLLYHSALKELSPLIVTPVYR